MTDKTPPANKTAKADDRNLIASEESQTGPTLEDRLMVLWEKNRVAILGLIVAILLVIVGRELWQYMQASKEAATREAFGQATTREQRLAFASEYEGHPLAGAALLAVADELYTGREYADAAQHYARAAESLDLPQLAARARLGEGMSYLQSDNAAEGVRVLEALAAGDAPESLRFEALFHLASHVQAQGDDEKARSYLDQLDALNPTGMWAARAASLRARLPAENAESAVEAPEGETPSVTLPE